MLQSLDLKIQPYNICYKRQNTQLALYVSPKSLILGIRTKLWYQPKCSFLYPIKIMRKSLFVDI